MAKRSTKPKNKTVLPVKEPMRRRIRRFVWRSVVIAFLVLVGLVLLGRVVNPPTTAYMFGESLRLDGIDHEWVPMHYIAPVMARSVVAAEDANFCEHWGVDVRAIKMAIAKDRTVVPLP